MADEQLEKSEKSEKAEKETKTFDFRKQLKFGQESEELFAEYYPRRLEPAKDLTYDFLISSSRQKLELKTDSYSMLKTQNFFMERFSDVRKRSPGGPWRSVKDKVDIFCYLFSQNRTWYEFRKLPELVEMLNELTKGAQMTYVKNRTWVTGGFLVPREALKDLYTVWEFPDDGDGKNKDK